MTKNKLFGLQIWPWAKTAGPAALVRKESVPNLWNDFCSLIAVYQQSPFILTETRSSLTSYSANLAEFSKSMSCFRGGVSRVARARQRRVSFPVPQSLIVAISSSFTDRLSSTFPVPTRTCVHLSITLSGAPCQTEKDRSTSGWVSTCDNHPHENQTKSICLGVSSWSSWS